MLRILKINFYDNIALSLITYLLAALGIFLIKTAIPDNILFLGLIFILTLGFFWSKSENYSKYLNIPYVIWARNLLVIFAVLRILPLTADEEFIKRCLISLALLNALHAFAISSDRDLVVSQGISAALIVLAPPFLLEGTAVFVILFIVSFTLMTSALYFYFRSYLMLGCGSIIVKPMSGKAYFKEIALKAAPLIFIPVIATPLFFLLARVQLPMLIVSPYHISGGNYIDYFSGKSPAALDSDDALKKYNLSRQGHKKWLILTGKMSDKIFLHGIIPGKGEFGRVGFSGNGDSADLNIYPLPEGERVRVRGLNSNATPSSPSSPLRGEEELVKITPMLQQATQAIDIKKQAGPAEFSQQHIEAMLFNIADRLWVLGRTMMHIFIFVIIAGLLASIIKSKINQIRLRAMCSNDPAGFVKKAYFYTRASLNEYIYPRQDYMTAQEYSFAIKNNAVEIGDSFEFFTNKYEEAAYSNHDIEVPEAAELYKSYNDIFRFIRKIRFKKWCTLVLPTRQGILQEEKK